MIVGFAGSFVVKTIVPLRGPAAPGVKLTVNDAEAPGAIPDADVGDTEKSVEFVPPGVALMILRFCEPGGAVLLIVIVLVVADVVVAGVAGKQPGGLGVEVTAAEGGGGMTQRFGPGGLTETALAAVSAQLDVRFVTVIATLRGPRFVPGTGGDPAVHAAVGNAKFVGTVTVIAVVPVTGLVTELVTKAV